MSISASVRTAEPSRSASLRIGDLMVDRAAWYGPGAEGEPPANVHGFVVSPFPRLVYHVVRATLGEPEAFAAASGSGRPRGPHTGILLGTVFGDSATADAVCQRLAEGTVHNPMLFFQSVPTSVLGALCRDYTITGPMVCVSEQRDTAAWLLGAVDELLDEEEIDQVLAIGIELVSNPRVRAAIEGSDPEIHSAMPEADTAVAMLVRRAPDAGSPRQAASVKSPADSPRGWLQGLIEICEGRP
ncbi:MAG TPA: hypothetical protein VH372_05745 [Actinospica sp.]|jgi:hypothetical protein|nr:hypothetical protein [Actinospica sp.]